MKKRYLLLAIPALLTLFAFTMKKVKTKRENINRRVIMQIPEKFQELSEEDIIKDYGVQRVPLAMFTNEIGDVTITVSETIDSLANSSLVFGSSKKHERTIHDLEIEKAFRKSSIMANFEKVTFSKEEVRELNKVPFIIFEFDSKLVGKDKNEEEVETEMYNYILYGHRRNRSYVINLAAPLHKKVDWKETFDFIVNSVNI
ncbi:MAG: hypothetical protein GY827_01870 [Cytophagales bacterium]|nr:hypothetical protein [Cytophagales bacterium]